MNKIFILLLYMFTVSSNLQNKYNNAISPISVILPNNCDNQNDKSWDELKIKLGLMSPCPQILNTVPVIINTTNKNYFNNTPYYTLDILPDVKNDYSELNDDKTVIKTVKNYYYYKTIDAFLKSEMIDLLGYLHIDNNKVSFIKNIKDYSDKLPTSNDTEKKIKHLEKNFLTKKIIYNIIKKYVNKHNVEWWKIRYSEDKFKKYLHQKLKELMEEEIKA